MRGQNNKTIDLKVGKTLFKNLSVTIRKLYFKKKKSSKALKDQCIKGTIFFLWYIETMNIHTVFFKIMKTVATDSQSCPYGNIYKSDFTLELPYYIMFVLCWFHLFLS